MTCLYKVGDVLEFSSPCYCVAPFLRDDDFTVVKTVNVGTKRKPHWRLFVSAVGRNAEGWLDAGVCYPVNETQRLDLGVDWAAWNGFED